jgi:hypothetical protein
MHEDLLKEGPREAPEPETAEQRSNRTGLKTAGGVVAGGGIAAAKVGALGGIGKFFFWLFAWSAFRNAWFLGGWAAVAVIAAIAITLFVLHRRRVI